MAVVLGRKPGGSGGGGGGAPTGPAGGSLGGTYPNPTLSAAKQAELDGKVPKSLYDANTILAATTDDTPAALTVGASTFVGRKASGNIAAMSATEAAALLTDLVPKSLYDANTVLAATTDDTPAAVTMGASTILARLAAGNIKAASVSEIVTLLAVPLATDVPILAPATTTRNVIQSAAAGAIPIVLKGHASQSGSMLEVQNSTGSALLLLNSAGFLSANAGGQFTANVDPVLITTPGDQFRRPLVVKGAASQSADLSQWLDSSNNILSRFNKDGYFMTRKVAAPADGDVATSELAIWFDNTNGAAKVMFKGKTANGTVATGSVTLT